MKNVTKKDLQDQLKVKAEVNSKLKSQIEELQTLISDKDKELTKLTDCLKIEKSSNDKLGNKLAGAKNDNGILASKVNNLETEVAAKDLVIDGLTEKLETKTIDFNNLNDIKVKLEAEVETKTKEIQSLDNNLNAKNRLVTSLESKLRLSEETLINEINNNYELKRKVKAHDAMSIVFGLVAVLAILGCIIFG